MPESTQTLPSWWWFLVNYFETVIRVHGIKYFMVARKKCLTHLSMILKLCKKDPKSLSEVVLLPGTVSAGLRAPRRCSPLTTCLWSLCNAWPPAGSPGRGSTGWQPPGSCALPGQAPPLWNREITWDFVSIIWSFLLWETQIDICLLINPGRLCHDDLFDLSRPLLDDLSRGGSGYYCLKLVSWKMSDENPAHHEWVF